jgi:hypothetical protein
MVIIRTGYINNEKTELYAHSVFMNCVRFSDKIAYHFCEQHHPAGLCSTDAVCEGTEIKKLFK